MAKIVCGSSGAMHIRCISSVMNFFNVGQNLLVLAVIENRHNVDLSKIRYDLIRDVSTGATGATEVAPKFSYTLTLSAAGGGADSAHHRRGCI